jgi:hypothetical protein
LAPLATACKASVLTPTVHLDVQPPAPSPLPSSQSAEAMPSPSAKAGTTPADGLSLKPIGCLYGLFGRFEAVPRPPAFDGGARAFDQATKNYEERRFLAAARDFMAASTNFLAADDVKDRRWSYNNATYSFAVAGAVDEGRAALLKAAVHDPALALELRQLASSLPDMCPR